MSYTDLSQATVEAVNRKLWIDAQIDPVRPTYHFVPPAMWMNDVNGAMDANGLHHLFYLHDPYQADGLSPATMPSGRVIDPAAKPNRVWGHAVTRDWTHWQYLPPAVVPEREKGEIKVISGGSAIAPDGTPLIVYTTTHEEKAKGGQYLATGDPGLTTFRQIDKNPVITRNAPGAPLLDEEFRDPFLFYQAGQLYCIVAGLYDKDGVEWAGIALYRAKENDCSSWDYSGMLVTRPVAEIPYFECPKIFPMEDRWVLVYSPYAPPRYMTGTLHAAQCRFEVQHEGFVDITSYAYATVNLNGEDGHAYLMSWVPGWHQAQQPSKLWGGCLSVPRRLFLDKDGTLAQQPVPEVMALQDATLDVTRPLPTDAFSLSVDTLMEGDAVSLMDGEEAVWTLQCAEGKIRVDGQDAYPKPCAALLLWDVCVGETFLDGGRQCVTCMQPKKLQNPYLSTRGTPVIAVRAMHSGSCGFDA